MQANMPLEGFRIRPESAKDPCEEKGFAIETKGDAIPEWNVNARTYKYLSDGVFPYNAQEQSCVWPPMLLLVTMTSLGRDHLAMALGDVRETLAEEGIQADVVAHTECVCWEGDRSYNLFVLPPSGLAYVAAKAVDAFYYRESESIRYTCYYPSLKDMIDIRNGRVPESSRQYLYYLNCHAIAKHAWNDLGVELLGDDVHPSIFKQAQRVLKDQAITCVAPWVGMCEEDGFDRLSAECSKTCQDAVHAIEKSLSKSDSEAPKVVLYDGSSFEKKFKMDERLRVIEIEDFIAKACTKRRLMEHLGRANGSHMARGVVKRLKVLHKLNEPGTNNTLIRSMVKGAEKMELSTLRCIGAEVEREKQRKCFMNGLESEIERFILKRREEQHEELLKLLKNAEASHLSKLEEFVTDRFKFVNSFDNSKEATESVVDWLAQHNAIATDKMKETQKQWEEKLARAEKKREEAEAELRLCRRELEEQNSAMKCAICFESMEGAIIKSNRENVVLKQRACFSPCMHTSMCLKCSIDSWNNYKRCPVCSTACLDRPHPIFM